MQLYVDLNCFNRPFDDQTQERVQSETDAVFAILRRIAAGTDNLIWSWALWFENSKHPIADRRDEIAQWQQVASLFVPLNDSLRQRARAFAAGGITALDALHLASAESGGADVLITCDDIFLRRARRLDLTLRVLNPVAYLSEVTTDG